MEAAPRNAKDDRCRRFCITRNYTQTAVNGKPDPHGECLDSYWAENKKAPVVAIGSA